MDGSDPEALKQATERLSQSALVAEMQQVSGAEAQAVRGWLEGHVAGNGPIRRVLPVDVRQSMANGGGPACLRLRVVADPAHYSLPRSAIRSCQIRLCSGQAELTAPDLCNAPVAQQRAKAAKRVFQRDIRRCGQAGHSLEQIRPRELRLMQHLCTVKRCGDVKIADRKCRA